MKMKQLKAPDAAAKRNTGSRFGPAIRTVAMVTAFTLIPPLLGGCAKEKVARSNGNTRDSHNSGQVLSKGELIPRAPGIQVGKTQNASAQGTASVHKGQSPALTERQVTVFELDARTRDYEGMAASSNFMAVFMAKLNMGEEQATGAQLQRIGEAASQMLKALEGANDANAEIARVNATSVMLLHRLATGQSADANAAIGNVAAAIDGVDTSTFKRRAQTALINAVMTWGMANGMDVPGSLSREGVTASLRASGHDAQADKAGRLAPGLFGPMSR